MATAGLNFIRDATAYEAELSSSDAVAFAEGLTNIRLWIADLIKEAVALELTYEGAQKEFTGILEWVGVEVKEYLDKQSTLDCMTFMGKSFANLRNFSDAFNVSTFAPVIVGMAITHHSLLMLLRVNVSSIPLQIYLTPLTSDATAASGQMALLHYVAQQSVAIWEKQSWLKPMPGRGQGQIDQTLESDHGSTSSKVQYPIPEGKMGLMLSKKDQLEVEPLHSTLMSALTQDPPTPPRSITPLPPPPLPTPVEKKHSTPKVKKTQPGSMMATLMEQFQQSHSHNASSIKTPVKNTPVKNMPVKDTPVKDTPVKGDLTPSKKVLTPDQTVELPVKKQHTSSPSSEQESKTDHGKGSKNKQKKKKKKAKSNPVMASDSEMEETEEQQEKCQRAKKWAQEMELLRLYRESCNIFLQDLFARNGGSHVGYLEGHIQDASEGHFFIWSFSDWRNELQKQSQGLGLSAATACWRLQMLERMDKVKLSNIYGICAKYLVEVFKYSSTRDRIPLDSDDMYGMTQMINLYGLVQLYSITRITTMQSGVITDGKKRSTLKCYCMMCDYIVQNHPSINNHVWTHLRLSLLCTIDGCFTIKHSCTDMWPHALKEHDITTGQLAVPPKKPKKKK